MPGSVQNLAAQSEKSCRSRNSSGAGGVARRVGVSDIDATPPRHFVAGVSRAVDGLWRTGDEKWFPCVLPGSWKPLRPRESRV
jgi:hypothetical protein